LPLFGTLNMPNAIRDAAPDAWGRRILIHKKCANLGANIANTELDELTYLLESGSDRIGCLDFQQSPSEYIPRSTVAVSLADLQASAACVERGVPLSEDLGQALYHGTSIGGARPKVLIESGNKKYIAKFSASSDIYSVVKVEFIAMRLAKQVGLHVATVLLTQAAHKDVLLIERFDRQKTSNGWQRKGMLSALTLFGLDEMMARYASYETLADIIRFRFNEPSVTLKELFSRLVFNILTGNTDDHARNHAAFWDGKVLTLTPAYDICPQLRSGNEASQAMLISGANRMSKLTSCIDAASHFLLSADEALQIIKGQVAVIETQWQAVCDEAGLSKTDRSLFWQRQFLNPYVFEGFNGW